MNRQKRARKRLMKQFEKICDVMCAIDDVYRDDKADDYMTITMIESLAMVLKELRESKRKLGEVVNGFCD